MSDETKETQASKEVPKGLQERLEKALAENAKLKGKVTNLTEELQVREATKGTALPTKKIKGQHYIATSPNIHVVAPDKEGKRVSRGIMKAEDVFKDDALCEHLVEIKSGFFITVEEFKAKQAARAKRQEKKKPQ